MDTQKRLIEIWSKDYICELPSLVKERGYMYSENFAEKDILITGFNASFRDCDCLDCHSFNFQSIMAEPKWDTYWSPLKKIIFDNNLDLREISAYLDIFYYREKDQAFLKGQLLKNQYGIRFLVDQINLTQHTIEEIIKPKVIIVKNKESAAYWGKKSGEGVIWMGYKLEFIQIMECGELYRICGLINSSDRIAPEISQTNLEDSLILFSHHINQYTAISKRPTVDQVKSILDFYYARIKLNAEEKK